MWYCTYSCSYYSIRDFVLDEDSLAGGGDAGKGKHSAFTRRAFFNQLPRSTAGFAPVKTSAMESLKHPTL